MSMPEFRHSENYFLQEEMSAKYMGQVVQDLIEQGYVQTQSGVWQWPEPDTRPPLYGPPMRLPVAYRSDYQALDRAADVLMRLFPITDPNRPPHVGNTIAMLTEEGIGLRLLEKESIKDHKTYKYPEWPAI